MMLWMRSNASDLPVWLRRFASGAVVWLLAATASAQVGPSALPACLEFGFSTEEDFVTQGPVPSDGNPIISDGDLLGPECAVAAGSAPEMPICSAASAFPRASIWGSMPPTS